MKQTRITAFIAILAVLACASGRMVLAQEKHDHGAKPDLKHDHDNPHVIHWAHSFEEALEEAKKAKKPLMIDFEAEWCGWCKKLDRDTYSNEKVIRFVRAHFVAVKVDTDEQPKIAEKYSVSGLPTILFLSPTGKELLRVRGYRAPEKFLEEVKKPANSSATLTTLKEAAEKDPGNIDAQRVYARALIAAGGGEEALRILTAATKKAPANTGLLFDIADTLSAGKRYVEASEAYKKILALPDEKAGKEKPKVYLPLGRILIRLRKHKEAIGTISKFIDQAAKEKRDDKDRWEAHFLRGFAHAVLKESGKAIADLEAVRDGSPDSTWGLRASYIIEVVKAE